MSEAHNLALDRDPIAGPDPTWEMLSEGERKAWIADIRNFPPPPLFLETLNDALSLDNYDPQTLAEKFTHDPVIAARLLSRANSAAFGLRTPVTSLSQAMVHLGFNLVRSTVLRYQMEASATKLDGIVRDTLLSIQNRADQGAVVAYHWAKLMGLPEPSHVATLCLLSRLGTFLLARRHPQEMPAFFNAGHEPQRLNFEANHFKITTRTLTYKVAQHWHLPETMLLSLFSLWTPLFTESGNAQECIASACLSLAFDPLKHQDDIDQWLEIRAHHRLRDNLKACGALEKLPKVIDSDYYQHEMAVVSG